MKIQTLKALTVFLLCSNAGIACAVDESTQNEYTQRMQRDCPGYAAWMSQWLALMQALSEPKVFTEPALRQQLKEMVTADQGARSVLGPLANEPESPAYKAAWKRVATIDDRNLPQIKAIIIRYGFPTSTMVGRAGAGAAWLLVQHADADPAFQADVLARLGPMMEAGEVQRGDVALLTDRVMVARGQAQRYGSQFLFRDGVWRPRATENYAQVDQRRAAMSLPPMADYTCMMQSSDGGNHQLEPWPNPTPVRLQ